MTGYENTPDVSASAFTFQLNNVSYSIDNKEIIQGITLGATERRIGIIGRNASGKTTLARLLSGLVAPSQGKVQVGGIDVAQDRKAGHP